MTKADVIKEISGKTGIESGDVRVAVEAFFSVIRTSMIDGHSIYIRGFGSFVNKKRAKKIGRHLSKNVALVIDSHYRPSFKPSREFSEKVKEKLKVV